VWLSVGLPFMAAAFLVRTCIVFRDCTHGYFCHNEKINDTLGTIFGVFTTFLSRRCESEHAINHAATSNLDKRGIGDIWVMTVEEYANASNWKLITYRFYRNPFIMFGLGPLYLVLISNRFNRKDAKKKERNNTYLINALLILLCGVI